MSHNNYQILPQRLNPLELPVLCRMELSPLGRRLRSHNPFKLLFPSALSLVKNLDEMSPHKEKLIKRKLKFLQKKRPFRNFSLGSFHAIKNLAIHEMNRNMKNENFWRFSNQKSLSIPSLRRIFKEAKGLKSLVLRCEMSNFKLLRKAKGLQNLDVEVHKRQILIDTSLFRGLASLKRITLAVKWQTYSRHEPFLLDEFFRFVLNLPKLQHLTVWLDECSNYYKDLLGDLNKKKLASFEIIAHNTSTLPKSSKSVIDWGNCIDALYIGPIEPFKAGKWPSTRNPERKLSLQNGSNTEDLAQGSSSIKNLEIIDFFSFDKYLKKDEKGDCKKLLEFISNTKILQNLKLTFGKNSRASSGFYDSFTKRFSQIKSLAILITFKFSITHNEGTFQRISPPYGIQMKHLKNLFVEITGSSFRFSEHIEALKDLVCLENLNFSYTSSSNGESADFDFSFEKLENLKSISLNSNFELPEDLRDEFCDSLSRMKNLESLKIEGDILDGMTQKKARKFGWSLREKKTLKTAGFCWKGPESSQWNVVDMKRVNGEMVVSLTEKK